MPHYYSPETAELFNCNVLKARKEGYFPSVTTVLGLLAKEGLVRWRIQQAVYAALTLKRNKKESDDEYVARVLDDSEEYTKSAADKGTLFHAIAEDYANGKKTKCEDEDIKKMYDNFVKWFNENIVEVIAVEKQFASKTINTGCKIDLLAKTNNGLALVDWKTQGFALDKPTFYPEMCTQLAGQDMCIGGQYGGIAEHINVAISTHPDNIGQVIDKRWTMEEIEENKLAFFHVRELFKITKRI